jgi:hypothetical protein
MTTKIVIIHDDLPEDDPLIDELSDKYEAQNVVLIKESQKGLDYVLDNLTQKIIVILDLKFKANEISGVKVFEDIRQQTSLVYIIIWTANNLAEVRSEDLVKFINNDALAFISSTDDYTKVLQQVERAVHKLDTRVASVIEQWIVSRPNEEKDKPYIMFSDGKTYSLFEILQEIRQQTEFGKEVERDMLMFAINLLVRKKIKIDD